MDNTRSSVIGAFSNIQDAQQAVNELHAAGFPAQEVKLIANEQDETLDNNRTDSTWSRTYAAEEPERKGGIMNFFARLFGLDEQREASERSQSRIDLHPDSHEYFTSHYQQRHHLVIVYTSANRDLAIDILQRCGALIEDRAGLLYDQELQRAQGSLSSQNLGQSQVMQLGQEELVANKEVVQTGEVSLRKEVITETQTIEVPVSREEVVIERRPIDSQEVAAAGSTLNASTLREGEEIRIPVSEERVTIDKRVVPREEIEVSKQRVEHLETISEDVSHEEVAIEKEGQVAMRGTVVSEDEAEIDEKLRAERRRKDRDLDKERPAGSRPYL